MPLGVSMFVDKETGVFQDLALDVEMPLDASAGYDMPVKIKGTFTTAVKNADIKKDASLFNWVSWTDPNSADVKKPNIHSVGCEVIYNPDGNSKVKVTNYKGNKSFASTEHKWDSLKLKDLNKDIRRNKREAAIDYYQEFKTKETAAAADRNNRRRL